MVTAPGMRPIFKTGVLGCSDAQPTESYGKSMDFGLIFARFRGLDAMCGYVCVNEQSRGRVCVFSRKVLIRLCCSSDTRGSEIAMPAEGAKSDFEHSAFILLNISENLTRIVFKSETKLSKKSFIEEAPYSRSCDVFTLLTVTFSNETLLYERSSVVRIRCFELSIVIWSSWQEASSKNTVAPLKYTIAYKHVSKIFNIISTKSYTGNLIQIIGDGGVTKPSILRRYAEFSIIHFCESKIPCL